MPITILDYVKSVVGDKDLYTAEDCLASGVDILGGCQRCHALIAVYNAYPSTSGYWRCAGCIGTDGFATVADFTAHEAARRFGPVGYRMIAISDAAMARHYAADSYYGCVTPDTWT